MPQSPAQYRDLFIARTRQARLALGWSQKDMAAALGISEASYQKYETRSMLPHHLIPKFAEVTGLPLQFLLTGTGVLPAADKNARSA